MINKAGYFFRQQTIARIPSKNRGRRGFISSQYARKRSDPQSVTNGPTGHYGNAKAAQCNGADELNAVAAKDSGGVIRC